MSSDADEETEAQSDGDQLPDVEEDEADVPADPFDGMDAELISGFENAPQSVEVAGQEIELDAPRRLMLSLLYENVGEETVKNILTQQVSTVEDQTNNLINNLWDNRDDLQPQE